MWEAFKISPFLFLKKPCSKQVFVFIDSNLTKKMQILYPAFYWVIIMLIKQNVNNYNCKGLFFLKLQLALAFALICTRCTQQCTILTLSRVWRSQSLHYLIGFKIQSAKNVSKHTWFTVNYHKLCKITNINHTM